MDDQANAITIIKKKDKKDDPKTEIMMLTKELPESLSITITNDDQFEAIRSEYKRVREIESKMMAKKKAILDPLNTAISELKSLFKPAETHILAISEAFALELGKYANSREIARLNALSKVNADKRIKSIETLQDKREALGDRIGGTMKIKRLIIDEPDRVPNEFWVIDEKLLKAALLSGREVKGARIVEELTVTAR